MSLVRSKTAADFEEIATLHAWSQSAPDSLPLNPEMASQFLQGLGVSLSPQSLARLRCVTTSGPRYHKVGKSISYTAGDLRAYAGRGNQMA